ncbi:LOW QUALITY PROTEIN: hypothetical protein PHMEG_00027257 [Phytophthora megakarya]|uniref:Retrotransposon gag domain-containing protein n=1 Tax=Phytophthora megakarya TaxID=4795 RepID=A0A225V900_9STRA|nr:LOW QUALITY PROTEIN: hypothetical protein PHMEG_00027257 [Phytophthora megakarya]
MGAFEKEFQTLRMERDQEREVNKNLHSFLVGRLKKQAERQGVCDNGLKPVPEVTTQVYVNSDSTTGRSVPSGVNMDVPPVLEKQMVPPEVKALYATQTQVALRDLDETRGTSSTAKAATTTAVKPEATTDVRKAPVEGKPRKRSTRKPDQGKKEPPKDDLKKKSTPPSQLTVKHGPPDDEPSDDDNNSDKESGDSDSDSSSFGDLASGTQARAAGQGTIMFNPMVNITALEGFDEKQPLVEKFQSLAVTGRWSGHAKVYYCKVKLSSAVRDWSGNLDESVRRSWKLFVKAFREKYCKAKTPDSEYYYTTFQRKSETPREFYYRLNKIAGKADIYIKSTDIARDRHLKAFIKKLKDTQLRSALQVQRVRNRKDLEHILKQHEEIWWSDDREAHPLKGSDRKADGAFGNRQRQKNHNRAYNVNEDEVFASDDEQQVLFDRGVEGTHQKVSFGESFSDMDVDGLSGDILDGNMMLRKQDVTSQVYRIMDSSGWRPPNSEYRSPPNADFGRPQQTRHCDNCGEGSHSTEFCWADMECNRCHKKGHPAKYCKVDPCPFCCKFHDGERYGLKSLQALKNLAKQGSLNDIPDHILNQLLDEHADPGTKPLNH